LLALFDYLALPTVRSSFLMRRRGTRLLSLATDALEHFNQGISSMFQVRHHYNLKGNTGGQAFSLLL
jgi:hypothetical protein